MTLRVPLLTESVSTLLLASVRLTVPAVPVIASAVPVMEPVCTRLPPTVSVMGPPTIDAMLRSSLSVKETVRLPLFTVSESTSLFTWVSVMTPPVLVATSDWPTTDCDCVSAPPTVIETGPVVEMPLARRSLPMLRESASWSEIAPPAPVAAATLEAANMASIDPEAESRTTLVAVIKEAGVSVAMLPAAAMVAVLPVAVTVPTWTEAAGLVVVRLTRPAVVTAVASIVRADVTVMSAPVPTPVRLASWRGVVPVP